MGFRCEEVNEDVDGSGSSVSWISFITYGKCASVPKHLHHDFLLFFLITIVSLPTPQFAL